ncbi:ABC transporter ATP-binding protein [Weissella cibaria]|uniref:ABC transporter ATP-binding protein n=1 Tax=Weissella cibaria TaxID=137591 RepID=UPI00143F83FD|nr:ABC transporter ATP-binding protein [Weissella cibaria]MBU7544914.1 ABC transporter ATP-binding protein [Weissella cibaria]MCT0957223.1 ABC transporter ATP-binding protein [Weissella cibaria]MCV3317899.1 ABC transporter ATP-binding protein [Weissella cibaria]NKN29585.1 ABC transporter ATP-binding protein [Weissella cibaria]NKN78483.1 ABC transporter ATP-binding protein [Weissella cibaria]
MNVRFEHVTLTYNNGVEVLHDMDFELPDGELIALLGPSGGGKSTTLNLVSGLLRATTGKIFFGDDEVTEKDALQRGVGMVFQNYALYPHMTVLENIVFPMKMAKVAKDVRNERARALAKLVRVDDQLNKKPGALSGGQQQRVAIARALAKNPSVLLLDEPLSNLDARLRVEMREEIRRIQQATGVTTIFVTHDQSEAMHVADKIMVLNDGVIQQFDSPQSLYQNPQNQFVARFIGEPVINEVPATALREHLVLPATAVTVGIRPEAIKSPVMDAPVLPVTAERIQAFGRDRQATLRFGDYRLVTTEIIEAVDQVSLDKTGVYAFNAAGERLPIDWDGKRV